MVRSPTIRTLEDVPESKANKKEKVVFAFIHVEPKDVKNGSFSGTKLVKNASLLILTFS